MHKLLWNNPSIIIYILTILPRNNSSCNQNLKIFIRKFYAENITLQKNLQFFLDTQKEKCYDLPNQTVEAEITVIMLPQRARVAESRVKNKSSNGPRRVQSNGRFFSMPRVFCNVRHALVVGGMMVPIRARYREARWHRG